MRPKLRTIEYTKSEISEGMDLLFKFAYAANEKSKDRFDALSIQSQKEQFAKDMSAESQKHALKMFEKGQEWDMTRDTKKQALSDLKDMNIMMYKGAERNREITINKQLALEEAIRKFGISPSDLHKTSDFPKLNTDVAKTYAGNAAIINQNIEQRKAWNQKLSTSLDDLTRQGAEFNKEIMAFAGKNKMLQQPEYWGTGKYKGKGFIDFAMTSKQVDFKMPDGSVRKGLGWGNHYGADWTFAQKGDPQLVEIAAAKQTALLTLPLKKWMEGESVILTTMFTPITENGEKDIDDVIDRIEDRLDIKFDDKQETEFEILKDVLLGTINPQEITTRILDYSSDESNKYNLDGLLELVAPEAWGGLKRHHAQVLRIESDLLEGSFIDDTHEAFRTASANMTTAGDMFALFHKRSIGMSAGEQVKLWDEVVEPRLKANNAPSPTGDYGKDYDIYVESLGGSSTITEGSDYAEPEAILEVIKTREAATSGVAEQESTLEDAYFDMKSEMTGAGERKLANLVPEWKTDHSQSALFSGRMIFNDAMLKSPENLKKIRKEVLNDLKRLSTGGWSPGEGFHESSDVKELLDLLRAFDKATSDKSQAELELEYKNALSSLAKF